MVTSLWDFSIWPLCPMTDLRDPTVPGIPASSLQLKTPVSAEGPACSVVSQMRESLPACLSPPPAPAVAGMPLHARTLDDSPTQSFHFLLLAEAPDLLQLQRGRGLEGRRGSHGPC